MQINITKQTLHLALFSLAASLLLGCGWQLRGYNQLNPLVRSNLASIDKLNVVSENRNNAFFRSFKNSLQRQRITLDPDADLLLELGSEAIRRQPLTYSRTGVPAQYQLSVSLDYSVKKGDAIIVEDSNLVTRRNYDFDPDLIIAKDREEQELLKEMRYELANRILSSIRRNL